MTIVFHYKPDIFLGESPAVSGMIENLTIKSIAALEQKVRSRRGRQRRVARPARGEITMCHTNRRNGRGRRVIGFQK